GHEDGSESWKHVALMPGLFHAKIADCHGLLEVHFGKPNAATRSPGSLAFHNTVLDRLPITLTSLPSFRVCRDLIMVSLYARILHCLLLVTEMDTLHAAAASIDSWETFVGHARSIREQYANADVVQDLRDERNLAECKQAAETDPSPERTMRVLAGDMVFENGLLFIRDGLHTRAFTDAIKAGDSGRIIVILKIWAFAYRGSGRTKYAHEMLHIIHNLVNVWPKAFRDIIINNWLQNPTGKDNAFVEVDLIQEHLNFWIKRVYKADGDAHSWDWLAMVAPCIEVLRHLARSLNAELGLQQGSKHTSPGLQRDIERLMQSLELHRVYRLQKGWRLDSDEEPVPDIVA
ncbi:hypothetical protein OF83DRAFT_1021634, partial [Amylostereum chailletii]